MTANLTELTERILKAVVQDAYDTTDIQLLINKALKQQATIEHLANENERLTHELEIAQRENDSLRPFTHLRQYAEESARA